MRDTIQVTFALVVLTLIGVACGWWSLVVLPASGVGAVVLDRYPAYRLEALRLEAENAQRDYEAAVGELENARADLVAAQRDRARAREAMRGAGWYVASEAVPLN